MREHLLRIVALDHDVPAAVVADRQQQSPLESGLTAKPFGAPSCRGCNGLPSAETAVGAKASRSTSSQGDRASNVE